MKQIYFLLLMSLSISACATIRTVSNSPSTLAQFNNIQAAVDASSTGDSVYVNGSPNLYAAFTITNKRLTIMGPGWAPDKNLGFDAQVNGCTITGSGCSNTEIQGMVFVATLAININHPDNLRFIRNRFYHLFFQILESSVTYTGYLFEGNWFDNSQVSAVTISTYQNFLFQNNFFYENGTVLGGNITGFLNSINILFNHNLWYGPASSARDCFANSCRFMTITNNIFVRRDAANANSSSTFNNNITFNAATNNPWAVNSNVDGGGNVTNQDPQMVDQASANAGTDNPLLNFTIASGPANNTGSDTKDMGLLYDVTGSLNWTNSRGSRLPFIYSMNITNPTIPVGGSLSVQVEARKNN